MASNEKRSVEPSKRRGVLVLVGLAVAVVLMGTGALLGVKVTPYLEYIVMFGLLAELVRCRVTSR
ncbi:MAG: hypothetical protein D6705_08005 [Deltaproteobacteria bacterium]|nr:MAG: hypothetical protein D6705_08005 [Deltaproteobacteria bacterium]